MPRDVFESFDELFKKKYGGGETAQQPTNTSDPFSSFDSMFKTRYGQDAVTSTPKQIEKEAQREPIKAPIVFPEPTGDIAPQANAPLIPELPSAPAFDQFSMDNMTPDENWKEEQKRKPVYNSMNDVVQPGAEGNIAPDSAYKGYLTTPQSSPEYDGDTLINAYKRGSLQTEIGKVNNTRMWNPDDPQYAEKSKQLEEQLNALLPTKKSGTWIQNGLTGLAEMAPLQLQSIRQGIGTGTVGAAVGTLAGPGGTVAGFTKGMAAGSAAYMYAIEAGNAYKQYIDQGIDHNTARNLAMAVGGVNAALEMFQLSESAKAVMKAVPGGQKVLSNAAKEVIPTVARALGSYVAYVGEESLQEAAQQAVTSAGEEIGKAVSLKLPPDMRKVWEDAKSEFVGVLPTMAVGGFLPHLGQAANAYANRQTVATPAQASIETNQPLAPFAQQQAKFPSVTPEEAAQRLTAIMRGETPSLPSAPVYDATDTSVLPAKIEPVVANPSVALEVPEIGTDTSMPTQNEANTVTPTIQESTPVSEAKQQAKSLLPTLPAKQEIAATALKLPELQPQEIKKKVSQVKAKRNEYRKMIARNETQLKDFDAMISEVEKERDKYVQEASAQYKRDARDASVVKQIRDIGVRHPGPSDTFYSEVKELPANVKAAFLPQNKANAMSLDEAADKLNMSAEELISNLRGEKEITNYRDPVVDQLDENIQELQQQRQQYAEEFKRQEQEAVQAIEKHIKDIEEAAPGFSMDLQLFAKKTVGQLRKLVEELKSKGVPSASIAKVRALVESKDNAIAELKKQYRAEVAKARSEGKKAGRIAERGKLLPKLDKAKQDAKAQLRTERAKGNERLEREKRRSMYSRMFDKINTDERVTKLRKDAAQQVKLTREKERAKGNERLKQFKEQKRYKSLFDKLAKNEKKAKANLLKSLKELRRAYRKLRPEFREEAGQILDLFDYKAGKMTDKTRLSLEQLQAFVKDQQRIDPSYVVPPHIEAKLKRIGKRSVSDMTATDVKDLQEVIDHILFKNNQTNQMLGQEQAQTITEAQEQSVKEINAEVGKERERSIRGDMADFFRLHAISPRVLAQRMANWSKGTIFKYFYEGLNEGKRKKRTIDRDAHVAIAERLKPVLKDIHGWGNAKKRDTITLPNAGEVQMTKMELLSVYLSSLNSDNRRHLQDSGGTVRGSQVPIKFSDADFAEVTSLVESNPAMKRVAEAYQYVFDNILKKAINETSLILDGYEKALVDHYFPIVTNKDFEDTQQGSLARYRATLEGAGYLKERASGANTVRIEDASKVVERAIEMVSSYHGYAIPIRNARAILGHDNFKQAVKAKFGQPVITYWTKLFDQLEGNRLPLDAFEMGTNRLTANYSQAVLGANPSIVLQQFSSLPKAWAFVGLKHLLKGTASKADWEIIERYSPEIWKRRQGYVYREAGEIAEIKQASPWLKMIEYADSVVIGSIWNAVESEVEQQNPSLVGDAFYEKVALRVEEIIDRSQQTAEPINRSAVSRSESTWTRLTFAFTTEANATYNMVYEAFGNRRNDPKHLIRTVSAVFASALASAAMRMVINKWRDREGEWGKEIISALLSPVYFAQDIYDFFSSNLQFNQGNLAESVAGDLLRSVKDLTSDKLTFNGKVAGVLGTMAQLGGVPAKNVSREFETVLGKSSPTIAYEYRKMFKNVTTSEMKQLAVKTANGNRSSSLIPVLVTDMKRAGITSGEMSSYLKTKASDAKKKKEQDVYTPLIPVLANKLPNK